jgi:hypothetical protein
MVAQRLEVVEIPLCASFGGVAVGHFCSCLLWSGRLINFIVCRRSLWLASHLFSAVKSSSKHL